MPVALEAKYPEKIRRILDEQNLVTNDLDDVLKACRARERAGRQVSHSLHFDVRRVGSRQRLHLRVLVWRSSEWRAMRKLCHVHHARLHQIAERERLAFRVPTIVQTGDSPLVWDLTEFVPGINLSWRLDRRSGLNRQVDKVMQMIDIAQDLASVQLTAVPSRKWSTFVAEMGRMAAWSERMQLIDHETRMSIVDEARRLVGETLPVTGSKLAHGDYGPNNVLFPRRGKPWLIDFDALRTSAPGDSLGRLVSVSYSERTWCRVVHAAASERLSESEWQCLRTMAFWHMINLWRQMVMIEAPRRGVRSIEELRSVAPWAARQVAASKWVADTLLR